MIEYHGWANIVVSDDPESDSPERLHSVLRQIDGWLMALPKPFVVGGLVQANVVDSLWISGCDLHASTSKREVMAIYQYLAAETTGSYGLLYLRDDESESSGGEDGSFEVWCLARGKLSQVPDPHLSPFVPTIEKGESGE